MKRIVTISAVLGVILACSLLGLWYLSATASRMTALLEQAEQQMDAGDWEAAGETTAAARQAWEKAGGIIDTYINHDAVDSIGENLARLSSQLEQRQTRPARTVLETLRFELDRLCECEFPSVRNIL